MVEPIGGDFSNTEAGFLTFKAWVADIAEKHGKTAVIPGMEPTGHYWFALGKLLQDNGMKPVHVNSHHVKIAEKHVIKVYVGTDGLEQYHNARLFRRTVTWPL